MILFQYVYAILQEKALFSQKEDFFALPAAPKAKCGVTSQGGLGCGVVLAPMQCQWLLARFVTLQC